MPRPEPPVEPALDGGSADGAAGVNHDGAAATYDAPIDSEPSPDADSVESGWDEGGAKDSPRITTDLTEATDGSSEDAGREAGESSKNETGRTGIARLTPSTIDVNLGTIDLATGGSATVTLTNQGDIGTGPLTIVATAGLTVTGCSSALDVSASCVITITAVPTAVGEFSGMVVITANPSTLTRVQISVRATVKDTRG